MGMRFAEFMEQEKTKYFGMDKPKGMKNTFSSILGPKIKAVKPSKPFDGMYAPVIFSKRKSGIVGQ